MSKAKITMIIGAAVAIAIVVMLQYRTNQALRAENAALREEFKKLDELEALRAENPRLAKVQAAAEELERLRANQPELLRLRGEVTRLRREKAELATQAKQELAEKLAKASTPPPQNEMTPEQLVRQVGTNALAADGQATWLRVNDARKRAEKSLDLENIPAELWGSAIQQLKPVRVYTAHNNVAVVVKEANGTEEGVYIYGPVSSYRIYNSGGEGRDGFLFTPIGDNVWLYKRTLPK
jgi:uncharacterized protein YdcH (DUF465 family)